MFDDTPQQNQNPGNVPQGLPMAEPPDMFSDAGASAAAIPTQSMPGANPSMNHMPNQSGMTPGQNGISAVDMGMLKPASLGQSTPMSQSGSNAQPQMASQMPQAPAGATMPAMSAQHATLASMQSGMQQPQQGVGMPQMPMSGQYEAQHAKKTVVVIGVIVAVALLIGGSAFLYFYFVKDDTTNQTQNTEEIPVFNAQDLEDTTTTNTQTADQPIVEPEDTEVDDIDTADLEAIDDALLFGSTADSDNDGLDDARERDVNTDPNNWDTDGDGLSDGDEVIIWKSNPLNPDTDGDGFSDGDEVKNRYSPTGPGTLFTIPTGENNTSSAAQL